MNIFCPAKLNLFLHITGKKENGYHLLESMAVFLDLGDTLIINKAEAINITTHGTGQEELQSLRTQDNLVYKAIKGLEKKVGRPLNVNVKVNKNIPLGSGLGGGSANAAGTLKALNTLFNLGLEQETLISVGAQIGSDIPVCLVSKTALKTGTGTDLEIYNTPLPPMYFVLVNPNLGSSTIEVYQKRQGDFTPNMAHDQYPTTYNRFIEWLGLRRNDLQKAACALTPEIKIILDILNTLPSCDFSAMTGSGSTCFGIFQSKQLAQEAAAHLQKEHPKYRVASACLAGH